MKNLHIENSYNIWKISEMKYILRNKCYKKYDSSDVEEVFNRTYESMYVEWWIHNIGYYITKPFCFIEKIKKINSRFKDVDLEEWYKDI